MHCNTEFWNKSKIGGISESEKLPVRENERAWRSLLPKVIGPVHDRLNARKHTPRNIEMARESLKRLGANRGTVTARQSDATYRDYAGNGVLEATRA
jgi:hypothetical protein